MYCDKQKFEFHTKGKVIRTCKQYLREGFNKNYWYFHMGQGGHENIYYVKKRKFSYFRGKGFWKKLKNYTFYTLF